MLVFERDEPLPPVEVVEEYARSFVSRRILLGGAIAGASMALLGMPSFAAAAEHPDAFYDPSRWQAPWGVVNWGGYTWSSSGSPAGHKGLDIRAAGGVGIPALRGGRVTRHQSGALGNVVCVQVSADQFDAYAHVVPDVAHGSTVARGQQIGRSARANENPGTSWGGSHLHLTTGTHIGIWSGVNTMNPADVIYAMLGVVTPSPEPEPEPLEGDDMKYLQLHWEDVANSRRRRALCMPGTGLWVEWHESGSIYANALANRLETGSSVEMTELLFNKFRDSATQLR